MWLLRSYRPCGGAPWAELRAWYAREPGRSLAEAEGALLRRALEGVFGYHLLVVGVCPAREALEGCAIRHRVLVDLDGTAGGAALQARSAALPLRADSVDAVVLAHALDFEPDPYETLREAERVLVPEGHLVVLGFNPLSLWGARWALARGPGAPWCGRRLTVGRLHDWLSLLGFDVLATRRAFFRPPARRAGLLRRLGFLERAGARAWPVLGAVYVVLARKRVIALTPVRPRWRPRRALAPAGGLVEPTPRGLPRAGRGRAHAA